MTKNAIILLNLGGPDRLESVGPFLRNFFNDPAIISAPQPIRRLIAWIIERKRTPVAQDIYRELGGASPLLPNSQAQAKALEQLLNKQYPDEEMSVFVCMRYWHPMSDEIVRQVKEFGPDKIILLPLYPQFSTTTTGSSFTAWQKACDKVDLDIPTYKCGCYPENKNFIASYADLIYQKIQSFEISSLPDIRFLFSAHGLPEKIIEKGDPYQFQIERTCSEIVTYLSDHYELEIEFVICYQSRVGPLKWIGPDTEEEIKRAGRDEKGVCLIPVAFVSEHSETLVELDIEYYDLAQTHQVSPYIRVATPSCHPLFIEGLASEVSLVLKQESKVRICQENQKCGCFDV